MSEPTAIYIGIDNGVSGAACAISAHAGDIIAAAPMPVKTARSGREIDVRALWEWIIGVAGGTPGAAVVVVEEPGGSKSFTAARSMAASFGAIRGMLEVKWMRWERITPAKWQREMLPGCKAGETKKRAVARAMERWPGEAGFVPLRCRVPHSGIIDAALIAEFGRRARL